MGDFINVQNLSIPEEGSQFIVTNTYTVSFYNPYEMFVSSWNPASDNIISLFWYDKDGHGHTNPGLKDQVVVKGQNTFSFRLADYNLDSNNISGVGIQLNAYVVVNGNGDALYFTSSKSLYTYGKPIFYTACGAPTACSVSSTLATGNVTLSWSGATAGTANTISSYEIQRAESSDGSTWGSWAALTTVATTATSGSVSVAPPTKAGNYYKFRVRTRGSAGSSYYSGWKESTNTLRRNWTACGAPTSCAVDSTLSLVATTLRWSGATDGYGNPISKYEVQRRSQAPGGSWSAWSAFETTSGTSLSVSPPATAGHYYQYRVRAQGTAGEAYYSGWKESTNTLRKAHKTIPAFTDPTLIVGQTDVKAIHITELQSVMNDILLPFMGMNAVTFTKLERDSDAKHWGDHVQEIKDAIDSTGFSHEAWVTMQDEVTADVIEQLRRIVKSM